MPVPSQLRLPHPLRFSKGGHLERLRNEIFSVPASSTSCFLISAPIVILNLSRCYPPFEHREGWGSRFCCGPKGRPASQRWIIFAHPHFIRSNIRLAPTQQLPKRQTSRAYLSAPSGTQVPLLAQR